MRRLWPHGRRLRPNKGAMDMNCPKCGSPLINTLLPIGGNTYQTTWNCYECDIWWDYETGKPITVTTIDEDPNA